MTMLVSSVPILLPWCSSKEATFNPVCMVNRIIVSFLSTLSVKRVSCSKLATFKFLRVCKARSATPVPVCDFGWATLNFDVFHFAKFSIVRGLFNTLTLSDFSFSRTQYRFINFSKKFHRSFRFG